MAGADISDRSDRDGGANYLCLPEKPKYSNTSKGQDINSARIDGVKYGESNFQSGVRANKPIRCAMCQVVGKTDNIMVPASNKCPQTGWTLEYIGYLATQLKYGRTEYICLADNRNLLSGTGRRIRTLHSLDKVQPRCNVLPCGERHYQTKTGIRCVVCTR